MKTSEILLQAYKKGTGETQNKINSGKGLKHLLILFMLSWIFFLPSCAVAYRTPEPNITIETHHHWLFHRNHYHEPHHEYHDQDDHHR